MELYNDPSGYRGRVVTYQVAFRGCDGMVLASDRCEFLEGGSKRDIRKVQIDPSGKFAWAYAGRQFSSLVASSLREGFATEALASSADIEKSIRELSTKVLPDIAFDEKPRSTILWMDGPEKQAYRAELLPKNLSIFNEGPMWTAGNVSLIASLIPERFFDESMGVDQLAILAAYTIWMAHKIDPMLVDGLDIAVYRDSDPQFRFLDSANYWQKAESMNKSIKDTLSS
jgi:hypothetical protein